MSSPPLPLWLALWPRVSSAPRTERNARPEHQDEAPLPDTAPQPPQVPDATPGDIHLARQALGYWALQFSPKVCALEDAVLLELSSCLRLFGGLRRLHHGVRKRLAAELRPTHPALPPVHAAWGRSAHAALALARAGVPQGLDTPAERLNALPLAVLSALRPHRALLWRVGCRTLGDVRRLPRDGLTRRVGPEPLAAMDQTYGEAPEAHDWIRLPVVFDSRLELPYRIDHAPALLTHVQPLLMQLGEWLSARHAGVDQLHLLWRHDAMRARDVGPGGELALQLSQPCRDAGHLLGLLGEHLMRQTLQAPVAELRLRAEGIRPLPTPSASLLWEDSPQQAEALPQLLERLSARLGAAQVRCGTLQADHRPEHMQHWQPWSEGRPRAVVDRRAPRLRRAPTPTPPQGDGLSALRATPQPSWLLSPPLLLPTRQDLPVYQGVLQILLGPQRLECGWWGAPSTREPNTPAPSTSTTSVTSAPASASPLCLRDYYLARSPEAGLLWVFLERSSPDERRWYLHGVFA